MPNNHESQDDGQRYVSYRDDADHFSVRFFSGPLDGAEIITDVFPDNRMFVHHVNGRDYLYSYERVGINRFDATLHSFASPQRPLDDSDAWSDFVLVLITAAIVSVTTALLFMW